MFKIHNDVTKKFTEKHIVAHIPTTMTIPLHHLLFSHSFLFTYWWLRVECDKIDCLIEYRRFLDSTVERMGEIEWRKSLMWIFQKKISCLVYSFRTCLIFIILFFVYYYYFFVCFKTFRSFFSLKENEQMWCKRRINGFWVIHWRLNWMKSFLYI